MRSPPYNNNNNNNNNAERSLICRLRRRQKKGGGDRGGRGGEKKRRDEWLTDGGCSCIIHAHFSFRENDLFFRSKILYLFLKEVKKHISGNDAMPASKQRAHVPSDQTPRENAPSFFSKLSCRMKGDKEQEKNVM